jgi:hypothetical protein
MNPVQFPLVDKAYKLEKFPGKGGWTYAVIPEIPSDKHAHFGWVRVSGSIDGYPITQFHLMPMGNGKLFFPVKAAIRKAIGKVAGDTVSIILFKDDSPLLIPDDLLICLKDEPEAFNNFELYTDNEKKLFCDWITSAKTIATRDKRIAATVNAVLLSLTFAVYKAAKSLSS